MREWWKEQDWLSKCSYSKCDLECRAQIGFPIALKDHRDAQKHCRFVITNTHVPGYRGWQDWRATALALNSSEFTDLNHRHLTSSKWSFWGRTIIWNQRYLRVPVIKKNYFFKFTIPAVQLDQGLLSLCSRKPVVFLLLLLLECGFWSQDFVFHPAFWENRRSLWWTILEKRVWEVCLKMSQILLSMGWYHVYSRSRSSYPLG